MHGKPGWPRPMYSKEIKRPWGTPGRSEKPGTQPGHPRPAGLLRRLSKNPLSDNHTCDFGLSPWLLGNQSNDKILQHHAKIQYFCSFWVHPPPEAIERPRAPQNNARTPRNGPRTPRDAPDAPGRRRTPARLPGCLPCCPSVALLCPYVLLCCPVFAPRCPCVPPASSMCCPCVALCWHSAGCSITGTRWTTQVTAYL